MATFPVKELAIKLDLVHFQSKLADQTKSIGSLELLEIWHHQIIEARIYEAENKIPDAPNEIKLAIADIETFESKEEDQKEGLNDFSNPVKKTRPKIQEGEDDEGQPSFY